MTAPKVQKNFRFDPDLAESLRRNSRETDRTETEIVSDALASYLASIGDVQRSAKTAANVRKGRK